MRSLALLLTAAILGAGCLEFGGAAQGPGGKGRADADAGTPCPETVSPPSRQGRAVEVQVANNMEGATCARVYFNGALVAAGELQGEHPALHNNPAPLGTFEWDAAKVLVRVEDSLTGRSHEEGITLEPGKTWVAIWIGKSGFAIRTFQENPTYP